MKAPHDLLYFVLFVGAALVSSVAHKGHLNNGISYLGPELCSRKMFFLAMLLGRLVEVSF